MLDKKLTFRTNNFDLIRLFAASQVAIYHTVHHLSADGDNPFLSILDIIPGVPIFFFVSGYLISKSYESNSKLEEYGFNRFLRLFPVLFTCTAISIASVIAVGYLDFDRINMAEFTFWLFGQTTIFQIYNPEFMRGYGTGVLNGSLWTIAVEIQFYLLIPILYWFLRKNIQRATSYLLLLIVCFLALHQLRLELHEFHESLIYKLYGVSFMPWLYMFMFGVLFQQNFSRIYPVIKGRFLIIAPIYILAAYVGHTYYGFTLGNEINPGLFVLLSTTVFSAAYTWPTLSERVLGSNDISYGVYIYHMPIINLLLYLAAFGVMVNVLVAILSTLLLACLSWFFVEKRLLKLKLHPLKSLTG